jgi:hypothetical protein
MHIKIQRLTLCLLAGNLAMSAHAISAGFYMGMQAGLSNLNNNSQIAYMNIPGTVTPPTFLAAVPVTASNTGIGERLFMGVGVNPYLAFEGGFTHYAPTTYKPSPNYLTNNPTIRENALDLVGKIMSPLAKFNVFSKIGAAYVRKSFAGSLITPPSPLNGIPVPANSNSGTTSQLRPTVALGGSYEITQNWVVDASWSRVFKGGNGFNNLDFMALGFSYHIVDLYCGQFLC